MNSTQNIIILACLLAIAQSTQILPDLTPFEPLDLLPLAPLPPLPEIKQMGKCIADATTRCLTNKITTCIYNAVENMTACTLETTKVTRVIIDGIIQSDSMDKTLAPTRMYTGNLTANSTSDKIENLCVADKDKTLDCKTRVTTCRDILSLDPKCFSSITKSIQGQPKIIEKIPSKTDEALDKKCAQASLDARDALQFKEMTCKKLNQTVDQRTFDLQKQKCIDAGNRQYKYSLKKAKYCNKSQ